MTYCEAGDKAKVRYKFADGEKLFESQIAPIEISTREVSGDSTENYSSEGYGITFYSTNNRSWASEVILDYKVVDQGGSDPTFRYVIYLRFCGRTSLESFVNVDPNTILIDPNKKCPSKDINKTCLISISYKGKQIFSDTGKCPVNFNVACNDECPPDHIRCETSAYPGYCCIPCNEIKSEIAAMRSIIRRING